MIAASIQYQSAFVSDSFAHFALPLNTDDFEEAIKSLHDFMQKWYPNHVYTLQLTRTDGESRHEWHIREEIKHTQSLN